MITLALERTFGDGKYMGDRMIQEGAAVGPIHLILAALTWVAFLSVLIALTRWLWLKGDKEKKGK